MGLTQKSPKSLIYRIVRSAICFHQRVASQREECRVCVSPILDINLKAGVLAGRASNNSITGLLLYNKNYVSDFFTNALGVSSLQISSSRATARAAENFSATYWLD